MNRFFNLVAVAELYLEWGKKEWSKNGRSTRQWKNMRAVFDHFFAVEIELTPLDDRQPTRSYLEGRRTVRAIADIDPDDFTRADLRDFVDHLSRQKKPNGEQFALNTVNKYHGWIVSFFKWAADDDQQLIDSKVPYLLSGVKKIKPGRTPARRTARVKAAPEDDIRKLIQFCRDHARSLPARSTYERGRRRRWHLLALALEVHWESGMRPHELVQMRPCDIKVERDAGGEVWWIYEPAEFKTEHHDVEQRRVFLNAMAQMALREAIELNKTDGNQFTFAWASGFSDDARLWPWKCSDIDSARNGYYNAVVKALREAKLQHITPNQIRHAFATRAAIIDLEGARAQLGHRDVKTTLGYVDQDGRSARNLLDRL